MLSVYSPYQLEPTSSYPFHTEMRSNLSSHTHSQQHPDQEREQQKQQQPQEYLLPKPSTSHSFADWKSSAHTPSSAALNSKSSTNEDIKNAQNYYSRSSVEHAAAKLEAMIPSQTQAASPSIYSTPFYSSTDYNSMKTITPQLSSPAYMSPYPSHNRTTIHDRRQSMMTSHGKAPNTPSSSLDARSRQEYPAQNARASLTDEMRGATNAPQPPVNTWDPAQQSAQQPAQAPALPPLSEALHGLTSSSSPSMAVSPPMQTQQAPMSTMSNVVASPPNFYAPNPYLDMQGPVNVYPQDHVVQDRYSASANAMIPQDSSAASNSGYARRVAYSFVPSLETGAGMVMTNVMPSEAADSGAFTHGNFVGANSVSMQGIPRGAPTVDYVDSLALQQHQVHGQPPSHHHTHAPQSQAIMQTATWSQNGGDVGSLDGSSNGSKVYSFVPLSGVNSKKRPRRRFDEIERLYVCSWGDCEKAYGTLNHLNAHVNMQKHGPKRLPAEFKELRKAWRKHKRAEEEAAKQAAAAFHQQQAQSQQAQLQQPICDPVMNHMHPAHHPLTMHTMTHHQPHQLPQPHAHPNQHQHSHHSQHRHPMGF